MSTTTSDTASSSSPHAVPLNGGHPLPIKLSQTNFPSWKAQISATLHGHRLYGFVDGTKVAPTNSSSPEYAYWFQHDQLILAAILCSLTESIVPLISTVETSAAACTLLTRLFASKSRSRVMQIKDDLARSTIGTRSVDEYLQSVKIKADELAIIDRPLSDDGITLYVLNGLGSRYREIAASIRARETSLSFAELRDILVSQELYLQALDTQQSNLVATANNTGPSSQGRGRSSNSQPRGRGIYRGRGQRQNNFQQNFPPNQACGNPNNGNWTDQSSSRALDIIEKLKAPSDAKLMKIAIDDLNNLSLPLEDLHRALQELLILVEPIDNANDLHKLGGFTAVTKELNHPNPEIRTISAWILAKASQNNPLVQNQILKLGVLPKLIEMVRSDFIEEAGKALYAVSALIRSNNEGQELFYMQAGDMMLKNILSNSSVDIRLRRKSVFLLADLIECQLDSRSNTELPFFSDGSLIKSVVDLMASEDLDLQEKALYAVKNLLLLRYIDAQVFKDVCELDVALGRMRQQLQHLIMDDNLRDYALDVEILRGEVELIFLERLEKVKPSST